MGAHTAVRFALEHPERVRRARAHHARLRPGPPETRRLRALGRARARAARGRGRGLPGRLRRARACRSPCERPSPPCCASASPATSIPHAVADALEVVPRSRPFEADRAARRIDVADGDRRQPRRGRPRAPAGARGALRARRSRARAGRRGGTGGSIPSPIAWQGGQLSRCSPSWPLGPASARPAAARDPPTLVRDNVHPYASTRVDGASYDRISGTMESSAWRCSARLGLRGDETVLDAGCGSGRVTESLLERLPRGRVMAVDGSPSMASKARERLDPERARSAADLLELALRGPVDAAISTATFHRIFDHETLFARIRAALRPGAHFVAQCGGKGNIERARGSAPRLRAGSRTPSTWARSATSGITRRPSRRARDSRRRALRRRLLARAQADDAAAPARVPRDGDLRSPPRAAAARAPRTVHR